eukprot:gene1995-33418_t
MHMHTKDQPANVKYNLCLIFHHVEGTSVDGNAPASTSEPASGSTAVPTSGHAPASTSAQQEPATQHLTKGHGRIARTTVKRSLGCKDTPPPPSSGTSFPFSGTSSLATSPDKKKQKQKSSGSAEQAKQLEAWDEAKEHSVGHLLSAPALLYTAVTAPVPTNEPAFTRHVSLIRGGTDKNRTAPYAAMFLDLAFIQAVSDAGFHVCACAMLVFGRGFQAADTTSLTWGERFAAMVPLGKSGTMEDAPWTPH